MTSYFIHVLIFISSIPGIAMLFSAGTFLYVATVHVLPELTHPQSHTHSLLPMADGVIPKKGFGGLLLSEMIILTVGALMPLLLTMGHKHWWTCEVCVLVLILSGVLSSCYCLPVKNVLVKCPGWMSLQTLKNRRLSFCLSFCMYVASKLWTGWTVIRDYFFKVI